MLGDGMNNVKKNDFEHNSEVVYFLRKMTRKKMKERGEVFDAEKELKLLKKIRENIYYENMKNGLAQGKE
jgi:hypothetical protein